MYVTVKENKAYICILQWANLRMYVTVREKMRICFKTRPGKGERLKTQTQSEQKLSRNDVTRKTIEMREI
jgi:hypothetical protein